MKTKQEQEEKSDAWEIYATARDKALKIYKKAIAPAENTYNKAEKKAWKKYQLNK